MHTINTNMNYTNDTVAYLFVIIIIVILGAIISTWFTREGMKNLWWVQLAKSDYQPDSSLF